MMNGKFFTQAGFLQFEIAFGDPAANLEKIRKMLEGMAPEKKAMVALPELWAYGFAYDHAEELVAQTPGLLEQVVSLAKQFDIFLAGSLMEKPDENGQEIFNTLFFAGPDGILGSYRKQHLFSLWQEDRFFEPGGTFNSVSSPFGDVGGMVCYDLRFPEVARRQSFLGAVLLVISAEWPATRIDHWQSLVRARAVENQVFVVACNSCGNTGEHELGGHSMLVGPDGSVLLEAGADEEALIGDLDGKNLSMVRSRFCPAGERPRPIHDKEKGVDLPRLLDIIGRIRRQQSTVAFTNGCFDILHSGHVAYLEKARSTADCLVVGLNSDRSVKAIKGDGRPVNSELDRARVLSALACVDYVVLFDEETPYKVITAILPDILVKGADWAEEDIVGAREVKAAGGKVVRVAFEHNVSTSELISRIRDRE